MIAIFGAIGLAQSPGTFTNTGNLSVPRQFHTATLLPNGKVLITGGVVGSTIVLNTAELYDSGSGTFSATGSMTTPRYFHCATLLPDGKVLITGGSSQEARAELYDPASGTFSPTGAMTTARGIHTAILLNNGKVLIAGGTGTRMAETYDPSTGAFTPTGDMTEPGADTATLLPNGKVLITRSVRLFEEDHADLYDPATGSFTRTGDIVIGDPTQFPSVTPGQNPSAVLLTNGAVLIAGGAQGDFWATGAQLYDVSAGTFRVTGELTAGIGYWQAAALLPEGRVLIAGEGSNGPAGTAELYDPVTGTFSAPFTSQSQEGHTATLLADGTVLLSGGWVCCGSTIATAEIYHPAVLLASPVLFSLRGTSQGAILHASTQQVVSADNPAVADEALEIYCTGLIDGAVIPPQVAVGGQRAAVLYFGPAPGYPGLNQINVRVPSGLAPGPAVAVRLNYLGRPSNEVTVAVQ